MSKVGILENIKLYVFNIIEDEYKKYLQSNKLLLLERSQLMHIIDDYYTNNSKTIKTKLRDTLKEQYKDEYNSGLIENILLDIFQEKDLNIIKITNEIILIQEKNIIQVTIPIVNDSLNLNISFS